MPFPIRVRFPGTVALLSVCALVTVHRIGAQPVAPSPDQLIWLRGLRATPSGVHALSAPTTPLTVDLTTRSEARAFYRAIYPASDGVPMGWSGSLSGTPGVSASGTAGGTSAAFKQAVLLRINWFRATAGVPATVAFNDTYSANAQQAALMMSANNALSHYPPTSWQLYTSVGANAAANSDLAIGNAGADAITAYIFDYGSNNAAVGHRRWLLYPQTQTMGTGDIPATGSFPAANATWVQDGLYGTARPATRDTFVAWPPPGYVPYEVVFPRWSFSYPSADFSAATVSMTRDGVAIAATPETLANGYGENTFVWVYGGIDAANTDTPHPRPAADTVYSVKLDNVVIGGTSRSFNYEVTVFDPDVVGVGEHLLTISGPDASGAYAVGSLPSYGSGFEWRTVIAAPFAASYGAEGGLQGVIANTDSAYNPVQSSVTAAGGGAYHLAHTQPELQTLTLPGSYTFASGSGSLHFQSRLGWATATETARVQLSFDDGNSWTDVWTQAGTGTSGELSFVTRSVALDSYAGRVFEVRFAYTYDGQTYYPQSDPGVGWYTDEIGFTGVESATPSTPSPETFGNSFSPGNPAAGTYLQARSMLFHQYPLEWGIIAAVTATTTSSSRITNLSIRANAGSGADTLIAGFVVAGGSKAMLVRGVGPTLTGFGVTGALPATSLAIHATVAGTDTILASNTGWGTAANAIQIDNVATQLSAFPLPAGSGDSALLTTVAAGQYSAQITGINGTTGIALAEVYDADSASSASRLVNVSARAQVGAGDGVLIAGFVVAGNGPETVLIRGIGPRLADFGVGGVLPDPTLSLHQTVSGADTVLARNTGWNTASNASAVTAAAQQVSAFPLIAGSADSAMLITLSPGLYSAEVASATSHTGVALIEVYEVR